MKSDSDTTDPRIATTRRLRAFPILLWLVSSLLLAAMLFVACPRRPDRGVVWLTPAEFARAAEPGLITRLKYQVRDLMPGLRDWYRRRKPAIAVQLTLRTLDPWGAEHSGLGVPAATNATGLRAWILTPAELRSWEERLKGVPSSLKLGTGIYTPNTTPASVFLRDDPQRPTGWTMNLTPRLASRSVSLLIETALTSPSSPTGARAAFLRTNFALTCRVLVPNGGSVVVSAGEAKDRAGYGYWLICTPTATDAQGRPIKQ